MLTLTKESTNKDRSLKTQLTISSKSSEEKISGDRMWTKDGFFKDTIPELNLEKKNIPENSLFYINQSYILIVKNGDSAMYYHNFIIGQVIVAANQPMKLINAFVKIMKLNCLHASTIYKRISWIKMSDCVDCFEGR